MKKFLTLIIVLIILALALPVANLVIPAPANRLSELQSDNPLLVAAAAVLGQKCVNCHTSDYVLPFYAKLPVAKGIIEQDIQTGLRFWNLDAWMAQAADQPMPETMLAKLESSIHHDDMPPAQYLLLHWNHRLSEADKAAILAYVADVRAKHYAAPWTAPQFANEPVQPLPQRIELDTAKVALGNRLYHDVRLSGDDTISCATCHALDKGGTDQARFSTGINGQLGDINSPTSFNSGFNFVQFWDGRAATLEEQADGPVNNPIEMGSNWPQVLGKLTQDAAFMQEFLAVYPQGPSKETITEAIATFERSLITPDSPFDKYLTGDEKALSPEALRGYALFKEKRCATCHVGETLGGQSYEYMGLYEDYFAARGNVHKPDYGRFNVTEDEADRHKFKVPTLRNIAITFPYFHDGSTSDLKEAVRIMGQYNAGVTLSSTDVDAIVAFLKSLTGTFNGQPLS